MTEERRETCEGGGAYGSLLPLRIRVGKGTGAGEKLKVERDDHRAFRGSQSRQEVAKDWAVSGTKELGMVKSSRASCCCVS